jgi:ElaB/YqjD/DUF883 family membrane-anchored ribosome-binding protein
VGEQVKSTAGDLRSVAEELRNKDKEQPAKFAEQAASKIEGLGDYLSGSDGDKILQDVEDFARRQPWLVAALGAGLGLVASRFIKASSTQRYQARYPSSEYTSTRSRGELRDSVETAAVTGPGAVGYTAEPTGVPPVPPAPTYPPGTDAPYGTDPYADPEARPRGGSTSEL